MATPGDHVAAERELIVDVRDGEAQFGDAVSVIMPVLNEERHLRKAVGAVLDQDFPGLISDPLRSADQRTTQTRWRPILWPEILGCALCRTIRSHSDGFERCAAGGDALDHRSGGWSLRTSRDYISRAVKP